MSSHCHKCVLCEQVFESKQSLQIHFRLHGSRKTNNNIDKTPIKGEYSDKNETKSNSTLEDIFAISRSNSVKCDICNEEFETASKAISHKYRKHRNVHLTHFCSWCGKQFPIKHLLDEHMETHNSELKPKDSWKCESCTVDFFSLQALNYHKSSYHREEMLSKEVNFIPPPCKKVKINSSGQAQPIMYCHLCGSEYMIRFNLQKHIRSDHKSVMYEMPTELQTCPKCEAVFYNKKAYDVHNTYHRPVDIYVSKNTQRQPNVNAATNLHSESSVLANTSVATSTVSNTTEKNMKLTKRPYNISNHEINKTDAANKKPKFTKKAVSLTEFVNMNKDIFTLENTTEERTNKNVTLTKQPQMKNNAPGTKAVLQKIAIPISALKSSSTVPTAKEFNTLKNKGLVSILSSKNVILPSKDLG